MERVVRRVCEPQSLDRTFLFQVIYIQKNSQSSVSFSSSQDLSNKSVATLSTNHVEEVTQNFAPSVVGGRQLSNMIPSGFGGLRAFWSFSLDSNRSLKWIQMYNARCTMPQLVNPVGTLRPFHYSIWGATNMNMNREL